MEKLIGQILRFGIVGVLATLIDFGTMVVLHEAFGVVSTIAAGISFVVSLIFNYVASMRYVFVRREDMSRQREFFLFVVLSAVGLLLNEIIMWAGKLVFVSAGVNYEAGWYYVFVKVVATGLVMVWNFWSRKRWLDAGNSASDKA